MNEKLEQTLIGCCMGNPRHLHECVALGVTAECFGDPRHRELWSLMVELDLAGEGMDSMDLAAHLIQKSKVTDPMYPSDIFDKIETQSAYSSCARAIVKDSKKRTSLDLLKKITVEIERGEESVDGAFFRIEEHMARVSDKQMADPIDDILENIDNWAKPSDTIIKSGIPELDSKLEIELGHFTTIAARSGMGKSSLWLNYANSVIDAGMGVAVVTLEMSTEETLRRWAAQRAGVSLRSIKEGTNNPYAIRNLKDEAAHLASNRGNIFIKCGSPGDINQTRAWFKSLLSANPHIKLFVLDYIQLLDSTKGPGAREQKVAEISRGLRRISMDMGVAVFGLSQQNENGAEDNNPHASLSNLRESKAIGQDSNNVIFITPTEKGENGVYKAGGKMWVNIAKQRNGGSGALAAVHFRGYCTRFEPYVENDYKMYSGPISKWPKPFPYKNPHNQQNVVDKDRDGPMF